LRKIEFFVKDREYELLEAAKSSSTWREFLLPGVGIDVNHIRVGRPPAEHPLDSIFDSTPWGSKAKRDRELIERVGSVKALDSIYEEEKKRRDEERVRGGRRRGEK